jgi:hypothetical protein
VRLAREARPWRQADRRAPELEGGAEDADQAALLILAELQRHDQDPFETWATKDFCSAKALFIPLR